MIPVVRMNGKWVSLFWNEKKNLQVMWGKKWGTPQKEWQPGKSLMEIWVKDNHNKIVHILTFIYSINKAWGSGF